MRIKSKIKAFTLSEMLVVLVISGMVIALTMVVHNLVQKQLFLIKQNNEQRAEIQSLERVLWQDMSTHDAYFNGQVNQLLFLSPKDTINYTFESDYTLRNQDTLNVQIHEVLAYLNGEKAIGTRIDAIELYYTKKIADHKLFIYQKKDVAYRINEKMNQEINQDGI